MKLNIIALFCHSGRGIVLVFWGPIAVTKFQGEPLCRAVKCTGVGKFCKYCRLSQKQYEICPWLLRNTNESWVAAPCGLQGCKNWPAQFPGRMSYKAT